MAGGWSRDGAIQDQIDASVDDAVQQARSKMPSGRSAALCTKCDAAIPEKRRQAVPGVQLCILCQQKLDEAANVTSGFNRRGSKDSQLR